jgi:hypothetical protein
MLDAESSDRYLPQQDMIPAINSAISRAQSALGWALANRKGSEEALRDFTRIAIYQTDLFGSVLTDDPSMGYTVANIVAMYANPELQAAGTINPQPSTVSQYRGDLAWAGAGDPVLRITLEQAANTKNNAFMRGNEVLAANPGRRTYAYYENAGRVWMLPKSICGQQFVAMAQIEKFDPMTSTASSVNLPQYMTNLLAAWACYYLSYKQGAGETLGSLASRDAAELFNFTVN